MSIDYKLMPKHGERLIIDEAEGKKRTAELCRLQQSASIALANILDVMLINEKETKIMFPCRQCLLDVALEFRDLSEALKELAEKK